MSQQTSPTNHKQSKRPSSGAHPSESLVMALMIFFLFVTVTLVFFWQWLPHLHSALLGPPEDNMQDLWNTWYAAVARSPDNFFFTDLIRFPEGTPLYYQAFSYPSLFAIALLSRVFGTDIST